MNKLIVTALSCIASLALAAVTPAQAANDHYKCFKLKDAKTFKKATADIDVVGGHLSGLQNCQISAGAKEYCVPVTKSGVVVVQCSRATGRIAPRRRLRETGIVAGEDLTPQKARILLALMLLSTTDIGEIQQAFQSY